MITSCEFKIKSQGFVAALCGPSVLNQTGKGKTMTNTMKRLIVQLGDKL
jgi:hypothetical protein